MENPSSASAVNDAITVIATLHLLPFPPTHDVRRSLYRKPSTSTISKIYRTAIYSQSPLTGPGMPFIAYVLRDIDFLHRCFIKEWYCIFRKTSYTGSKLHCWEKKKKKHFASVYKSHCKNKLIKKKILVNKTKTFGTNINTHFSFQHSLQQNSRMWFYMEIVLKRS